MQIEEIIALLKNRFAKKYFGLIARCYSIRSISATTLAIFIVDKSSMAVTECPSAIRYSTKYDSINPAPPVTRQWPFLKMLSSHLTG